MTRAEYDALIKGSKVETPLGAILTVAEATPMKRVLTPGRVVITARQVVDNPRWKVVR